MSGPRYDLVPRIEPPLEARLVRPEPDPEDELSVRPYWTFGKVFFSAAVALLTGVLIATGLNH
jgi:hypothetical protein